MAKSNEKKIKSKNVNIIKRSQEKQELVNLNTRREMLNGLSPEDIDQFSAIPLSKKTLTGLKESGFVHPTKVQRQTLLHTLQGHDVVVAAKTGSGKTLAFIIPLLELLYLKLWNQLDGLGVLIITPTRELAYQIFDVINKVGRNHNFSVGLVIGGKDLKFEWSRIKSCNIVICTPGRLLHHMTENPEFTCENVQLLILDEADQCLSMGFAETMNMILEELPQERQTLLFSATQTRDVKDLIRAGCKNPIFCSVHENSKTVTPKTLKESYIICEDSEKITLIWSFLKHHKKCKILVFLATCKQVKFMFNLFTHLRPGLSVMGLHGDMHQLRRMAIYDDFCKKKCAVLFSTDVAARGLDIPSIDWVVHLDCPEDVTTYIHRAGRTARLSKVGESLLVLTSSQENGFINILKSRNIPIEKIDIDAKYLFSIQLKIEMMLSKFVYLKEEAEKAYKSYVKNIFLMKNKEVFDVSSIDFDAFARSLGLTATPRLRFLERKLKGVLNKLKSDNQESIKASPASLKTYNLGITQDEGDSDVDDDNVDFLYPSHSKPPVADEKPEDILKDYTLFTKPTKVLSKYDISQKIMKNKLQMSKRTVFDEEEEEETQSEKFKVSEGKTPGINVSEMKEYLKSQDKIDRQLNSQRLKEARRKERERLKENRKKEQKQEAEEADSEEESNDDIDPFTQDIIDSLPDPDKILGEAKSSSEEDPEEDYLPTYRDNDRNDEEAKDDATESENRRKKKREFKGKIKARTEAKAAKRARLEKDNDLKAISFKEKEDLALFLLQGNK